MRQRLCLHKLRVHNWCGGFSLVELLVTLVIVSVMMSVMTGTFRSAVVARDNTALNGEAQQGLRTLLATVTQEVRQAGACLTQLGEFIAFEGTNGGDQDSITLRIGRTDPTTQRCIAVGTTQESNPGTTTLQVADASVFRVGETVYITPDSVNGDFYTVDSASGTTLTLRTSLIDIGGNGEAYPLGTGVYPIDERIYATTIEDGRPVLTLAINGGSDEPFIEGVDTFDVRYGLAPCDPTCATEVELPADPAEWRLVREIRIKARVKSRKPDRSGNYTYEHTGAEGERGEYVSIKPRNFL